MKINKDWKRSIEKLTFAFVLKNVLTMSRQYNLQNIEKEGLTYYFNNF